MDLAPHDYDGLLRKEVHETFLCPEPNISCQFYSTVMPLCLGMTFTQSPSKADEREMGLRRCCYSFV